MHLAAAAPPAIYHMNFFQAVVIGMIQGFFELFPLSSLGHTVLIPSWIGGNWSTLVHQESLKESPYLAFIVGLHLANAVALLLFYLREWIRIIVAFVRTLIRRRIETDTERLAWLIVLATIPVGILGLVLEHEFRVLFAKPLAAALFLMVNGAILFAGEWYRRRHAATAVVASRHGEETASTTVTRPDDPPDSPGPRRNESAVRRFQDRAGVSIDDDAVHQLSRIGVWSSIVIGASQALALLAGISREGVAMVGGLFRGLSNENAMRFAFLLSTPVIFAAGALKVPDLAGHLGDGIRGQVVAGSVAAVVTSLLAIAFLSRYFKTRTLLPFAIYSVAFGLVSAIRFGFF
jgi:undecaprenyl-diphosphatase